MSDKGLFTNGLTTSEIDYYIKKGYELGLADGETKACSEGGLRAAYEQGKEEGIAKGRKDTVNEVTKIIEQGCAGISCSECDCVVFPVGECCIQYIKNITKKLKEN